MDYRSMPPEYFCKKMNAVYIINLVDYLNKNKITEENLDNEDILKDIIRKGMGKKRPLLRNEINCRNRTVETIRLYLQDIDIDSEEIEYIKNASIQLITGNKTFEADQPMDPIGDHPINVTIDDEETLPPMPDMPLVQDMILVVDQGLIISNKDEQSTNMMVPIEYHTINVPIHDEQPQPNMIQIIYPDMPSLNVDSPSLVSIPIDQGLIQSNKNELSTNMIDLIEDHPINVTTDEEKTLPLMPDMPLVQVDPSSVVPIPIDQGFLSRYSPNEVVLANRFKSYFWPAKIIEVYSDKMYVTFFPLSAEMEKEEVSSKEDVKAFTEKEIKAAGAYLCLGLSQLAFENAVKFASAELN
uniref:PWWP domain-containing protein n=1 Tax=Trichogramma kaykai TaxID=54128 RepID=A0ABD2W7D9_9HYME